MSDSIRRPVSKLSFITTMLTKVRSVPAPAPIAPPMKSIASFISLADLVAGALRRAATPPAPPGRACLSDRARRRRARSCRMLTTGCSWCSTATTCSPFGSVCSSYGGNFTSRAASGRGGPLGRPAARCAAARAAPSATSAHGRAAARSRTAATGLHRDPPAPRPALAVRPPDGISVRTSRFSGVK